MECNCQIFVRDDTIHYTEKKMLTLMKRASLELIYSVVSMRSTLKALTYKMKDSVMSFLNLSFCQHAILPKIVLFEE
jgi:hypothetical protein